MVAVRGAVWSDCDRNGYVSVLAMLHVDSVILSVIRLRQTRPACLSIETPFWSTVIKRLPLSCTQKVTLGPELESQRDLGSNARAYQ